MTRKTAQPPKAETTTSSAKIDYIELYVKHGGSYTKAAKELRISQSTFRYRYERQKRISFSEDEKKFKVWTAEECIDELRRIVESFPNKVITRNFFRVHSNISESTWTGHFGTFSEFKRQARVVPTRHQHNLEKQIAKHAASDHYREIRRDLDG